MKHLLKNTCVQSWTEVSQLPKCILPVKITWLTFFCGFLGENLQRSEQAHFLISWLHRSISRTRIRRARFCFKMSLLTG